MKQTILTTDKDPLGAMMLDYMNGDSTAFVEVESTTLEMWRMTGDTMFRTFGAMNRIERKALSLCRGQILDIGAGSGCHSLYLQNKEMAVTAIDQSPGAVEVMKHRKVHHTILDHLFSLQNRQFDTLLMLMNGIGITGSLDGLNLFFQFAATLLSDQGQILADSTDLSQLYGHKLKDYTGEVYPGETQFTMTYKTIISDPFDWIYIDFETLQHHAEINGFQCTRIVGDKTGKFLARIFRKA